MRESEAIAGVGRSADGTADETAGEAAEGAAGEAADETAEGSHCCDC